MDSLINKTGFGRKVWIGFLWLGLLSTGCIKTKRPPKPLLETTRVETKLQAEASRKKTETGQKKLLEEKPKEEASSLGEPKENSRQDPRMEAVEYRFQEAVEALKAGKLKEARSLLETLRDQYPGVSVFHHNLGIVYKRLERIDAAIKAYERAIGLNPGGGNPESYYNLAIAHREKGTFKKAERAYLAAITLAPDFEDAHFNLAVLYELYLDEPEKALDHYQKQIKLSDDTGKELEMWVAGLKRRLVARGEQE